MDRIGIEITAEKYMDIMALGAKKLGVTCEVLAKALCQLLAHIATAHSNENSIASVAFPFPLGRWR